MFIMKRAVALGSAGDAPDAPERIMAEGGIGPSTYGNELLLMTGETSLVRETSMRSYLVLMIGLFAIGNAEALATAPQIVDPREDLFEPSPNIAVAAPNVAVPFQPDRNPPAAPESSGAAKPDAHAAQAPAASAAEQEMPANPLWAIPLSRLSETRNRPPFSPSRRPPKPVVVVAKPVAPAAPPPKPPEPVTSQLSLVGTIVSARGGVGLFVNAADKSTIRLKTGENHKGWILRAIEPHQAELANGLDRVVLKLPPPDMKTVAAAPVAPSAGTAQAQSMPAPASPMTAPPGTPMPSSPVSASQPVNTAQSRDGNPSGGPRAAKLQILPLVYEPPPPPAANPFVSPVKDKEKGL